MKTEEKQNLDSTIGIILNREKETNKQKELIKKHIGFAPVGDLRMLSVEHFTKTGTVSGSLFIALKAMMDEYAEWVKENKTDL